MWIFNKSYLQALFTDKIGCTINHYINQKDWSRQYFCFAIVVLELRILHLLPGITADSIFLILLKKFYGLTPSAYRGLHARNMTTDTRNIRYSLENDRNLKGEIM